MALTVAGGALALLFARLLWPRENRALLTGRIVDMLEKHAALVRSLTDQGPDEVRAKVDSAADAADRLSRVPGPVGQGARGQRAAETQGRGDGGPEAAGQRAHAARGAAARRGAGPTVTVLDMVADRLERVAEAVRAERPEAPPDDLDSVLDELGAHVDGLAARRMDEAGRGGGRPDDRGAPGDQARRGRAAAPAGSERRGRPAGLAQRSATVTPSSASAASTSARGMPSR